MKAIRSYVIDTLERQNRHYKAIMVKNKRILSNPLPIAYTVSVGYKNSDMSSNVSEIRSEFLDEAMYKAMTAFIKNYEGCDLNHCTITVVAHFRNSIILDIPEEYWRDIERQALKKIKEMEKIN
jgi:hypothetical protein